MCASFRRMSTKNMSEVRFPVIRSKNCTANVALESFVQTQKRGCRVRFGGEKVFLVASYMCRCEQAIGIKYGVC